MRGDRFSQGYLVLDVTVAGAYGEPTFLAVVPTLDDAHEIIRREEKRTRRLCTFAQEDGRSHWWEALGPTGELWLSRSWERQSSYLIAIAEVKVYTAVTRREAPVDLHAV